MPRTSTSFISKALATPAREDDSSDDEDFDLAAAAGAGAEAGVGGEGQGLNIQMLPSVNAIEDMLQHIKKDDLHKQLLDLVVALTVTDGHLDADRSRSYSTSLAVATEFYGTLESIPRNAFLKEQLLSKLPSDAWEGFLEHAAQIAAKSVDSYTKHEQTSVSRMRDELTDAERQQLLFGKRLLDIAGTTKIAIKTKCNPLIELAAGMTNVSGILAALREHLWIEEASERAKESVRKGKTTEAYRLGIAECSSEEQKTAFQKTFAMQRYLARCDKALDAGWYPTYWATYVLLGAHAVTLPGGVCLPHLQGTAPARVKRDAISRALAAKGGAGDEQEVVKKRRLSVKPTTPLHAMTAAAVSSSSPAALPASSVSGASAGAAVVSLTVPILERIACQEKRIELLVRLNRPKAEVEAANVKLLELLQQAVEDEA